MTELSLNCMLFVEKNEPTSATIDSTIEIQINTYL